MKAIPERPVVSVIPCSCADASKVVKVKVSGEEQQRRSSLRTSVKQLWLWALF